MKRKTIYRFAAIPLLTSSILILNFFPVFGQTGMNTQANDTLFFEDWSSGQFSLNGWMAGDNWVIDTQAGNPLPSASFQGSPQLLDYSCSLVGYWLDGLILDPNIQHSIWLDFDLSLDDLSATSSEVMSVQVFSGSAWVTVEEYADTLSPGWKKEHLDITEFSDLQIFRIRFLARGSNSSNIQSWNIDNLAVYCAYQLYPPNDFDIDPIYTNGPVVLFWQPPAGFDFSQSYILDDNSGENGWAINPGYESWLGNEFDVNDAGILKEALLYFQYNSSASNDSLTVDIFDSTRNLIGSSGAFIPGNDYWQTIVLPDIPFYGTFYAMVRWNMLAGQTNYLCSDENGPNVTFNYGWYFDGITWSHLSEFGFSQNVFLIRINAFVNGGAKSYSRRARNGSKTGSTALNRASIQMIRPENIKPVGHSPLSTIKSTDQTTISYNIYRCEYVDPYPNYTTWTDWELIASTAAEEYTDSTSYYLNCHIYRVTAVYSVGESETTQIESICFYSEMEEPGKTALKIYPNPASHFLNLENMMGVKKIIITNNLGQVIYSHLLSGEFQYQVIVSNFPPAIYCLQLLMNNGSIATTRLIVTH